MDKFIPYEKMSKRARRELNKVKRRMWNCNPETKFVPDTHKKKREEARMKDRAKEN